MIIDLLFFTYFFAKGEKSNCLLFDSKCVYKCLFKGGYRV